MSLSRRNTLALAASALAAPAVLARAAAAADGPARVRDAVARFAALPVTAGCLVVADHPSTPWQAAHEAEKPLFVGSAVKTFMLAQYLRDVEEGRLTLQQLLAIDDGVRVLSSPVFLDLTGKTAGRNVLEAMIAHSDNTATDATLAAVGPDRVRALITEAGLSRTRIPDSTRRLFSYLAGAAEGEDLGWTGMQRVARGELAGPARKPMNDTQTMIAPAEEMVRWYRAALRGTYFKEPETLVEFKRISAMADSLPYVVPADTAAYGKGGSIDWGGFHCFALPGQMVVNKVPMTFCFTVNWNGPDDGVPKMFQAYVEAVAAVLREAAAAAG
ncbi:MAG: serine hydrolase [Variibacter sp.]